jgi:xanthine dehydrogenase molybdopterin-binding subunit B
MTMLSQVVAHELDIPVSHVHVAAPDTDISPYCIGSLASRVTIVAGNAAIVAARKAKDELLDAASRLWKLPMEQLVLAKGAVHVLAKPDQKATLGELVRAHIWRHGGEGIHVHGTWDADTVMHDDNLYGNVAPAYSFAAQVVEVEVDTQTGQVSVIGSFVSDDCGKALNPLAVHGQSNGASAQAIGWTLFEHLRSDLNNKLKEIAAVERAEKKKAAAYAASPEGIAEAKEKQRNLILACLEEKKKTGAYHWICCEKCEVIDWARKHTSCRACADWDGQSWNSFCVNGRRYTGD